MNTAIVTLVLELIAAMPQAVSTIQTAYQNIRSDLSANDQATIDAALAAANTKTDADMAQLDKDALAHGATA
ncbi:MAG TPA: hypothetical protein VG248_03330 [Caulobacteraceae bacterium]|jgi:hypothetical protein|nr:hypothetical protein [Caulobacteraceae bacterium]